MQNWKEVRRNKLLYSKTYNLFIPGPSTFGVDVGNLDEIIGGGGN